MNLSILSILKYAYQRRFVIFQCRIKSFYFKLLRLLQVYGYILSFKCRFSKLYIYLNYFYKVPLLLLINCFYNRKRNIRISLTALYKLTWLVSSSVWLFWTPFGLKPHWFLLEKRCGGVLVALLV